MHKLHELALGVARKFLAITGARNMVGGMCILLSLSPLSQSHAQTNASWVVNSNGDWSNAANWSSNPTVPGGAGSTISFTTAALPARTATIDATSRTVGILNFNATGGSPWTIAASGGASLIFDNGASNSQINITGGASGTNSISAPISLLNNLDATLGTGRVLEISGAIAAGSSGLKTLQTSGGTVRLSGPITNGSGTVAVRNVSSILYITGSNSFTGGVTLGGGRIFIDNNYSLGTGAFAVTASSRFGTVSASPVTMSNSSYTLGNNLEILTGGAGGTAVDLSTGSGSLTLTAGVILTTNGSNVDFRIAGNIGESGSRIINKTGSGNLWLSGSNTYSGGTTLTAGTLNIGNNSALGAGALTISGTATVSADSATARTLANNVTLNTSTGTATIGVDGTRGKLTFGNLTATQIGALVVNSDVTFANLTGAANIVKSGAGVLEFTGDRSGAGSITVNAGTLLINGTSSGTPGAVNINSGGTLAGAGTIGGAVTIANGATFGPGNSPGTMTFNNSLTLAAGSISNFEVNGFTSGLYDLALAAVAGTQAVSFDGTLNIFLASGITGSVKLFDFDSYSGSFSSVIFDGLDGRMANFDNTSGLLTVSAVPEPTTAAVVLLGAGILGLAGARRRVRRA